MSIERNVLLVDDSDAVKGDIKQYLSVFSKMKKDKGYDFELNFYHVKLFDEAIEFLSSADHVVDILMTDYNLSTAGNSKNGIELIEHVRRTVNKNCKIIFYTMNDISALFQNEEQLVHLLNAGIYRFLPKHYTSKSDKIYGPEHLQYRVENIIDAISDIDVIQSTLERYFMEFEALVNEDRIKIDGVEHQIRDIIDFIRRDTEIGRKYKRNLLESIIIKNMLFDERD